MDIVDLGGGLSGGTAFDISPEIVGRSFEGLTVDHLDRMPQLVREKQIRLAILAVPARAANEAVERLIQAGITGILNFAPVTLTLPKSVSVVGVDLAMELEQLALCSGSADKLLKIAARKLLNPIFIPG